MVERFDESSMKANKCSSVLLSVIIIMKKATNKRKPNCDQSQMKKRTRTRGIIFYCGSLVKPNRVLCLNKKESQVQDVLGFYFVKIMTIYNSFWPLNSGVLEEKA